MKSLSEQDLYETLDVPRGAGAEEIERAYRLACATYSDGSLAGYSVFEEGDVEQLRERIEVAYRTLSDPESRGAYDRTLAAQEQLGSATGGGAEPSDLVLRGAQMEPPELEPTDVFEALDEGEGEWSGARLRRTRMRQGFELEDISEVTKVNPTYLHFIEDERFAGLPAAVYVRGFVMGFAGCLGLDTKRVAASYMQRYDESKGSGKRRLFSRK